MKEKDRFHSDDITWCMAECVIDCPRKPKYIRDKTIPHSYADFSNKCMAYTPREDEDVEDGDKPQLVDMELLLRIIHDIRKMATWSKTYEQQLERMLMDLTEVK